MTVFKCAVPPDSSSYAVQEGSEVIATALDGGAARYRHDKIGATSLVNVLWIANDVSFQYLRALFNSGTVKGSTPILIDLILDSGDPEEVTAYFVPNTFKLNQQSGRTYWVTAQLEVKLNPVDDTYNISFLEVISDYGFTGGAVGFLNELEKLVNVDIPAAF